MLSTARITNIKGLSERRRLPRLGKIRLGVKVVTNTGKVYPREVNHFVVPPEVARVYGDKPTELDVLIPINDRDVVFPQAYKFYGSSRGLKCIGDGEKAYQYDEVKKSLVPTHCTCEKLEAGLCSRRAHLLVILPKVSMGGVYQIDMGSYNSIVDINSGLDYVNALIGRFAMVPLKLRRVQMETFYEGKRAIHYPLQLTLTYTDLEYVARLKSENDNMTMLCERLSIAPPEDINPEFDEGGMVITENELKEHYYIGLDEESENVQNTAKEPEPPAENSREETTESVEDETYADSDTADKMVCGEEKATSSQLIAITRLAHTIQNEKRRESIMKSLSKLTRKEAARLIVDLQRKSV